MLVRDQPFAHEAADVVEQQVERFAIADHGAGRMRHSKRGRMVRDRDPEADDAVTDAAYDVRGRVAVVTLDNPPVNGLGHALRTAIVAAVDRANADDSVDAIVLTGAGKMFSAGADIREFNTPKSLAEPTLRTRDRDASKAARSRSSRRSAARAMGGGLELALGCHYRVAAASAPIALPEVKLGLLPGAGGTQRLPRAVGVETALTMIVSGATVKASELADTALFDAVVDGDVARRGGRARAKAVDEALAAQAPARRLAVRIRMPTPISSSRATRSRRCAPGFPAPQSCVDAVAAAVRCRSTRGSPSSARSSRRSCARPSRARCATRSSPSAQAAAHRRRCPRHASRAPSSASRSSAPEQWARASRLAFLGAGLPVALIESERAGARQGRGDDPRRTSRPQRRRASSATGAADAAARGLAPSLSLDAARDADLVVEAVFEDMDVKRELFARSTRSRSRARSSRRIRRRSTSTRSPPATRRPQDVVGMHFFSPAHVMKLLEVVRGARDRADDVLATVMQLARRIGKTAVVARRVRRIHRQPHDRALPATGDVPGRGGRVAARRWTRRSSGSAWRWARSA